MKHQTDGANTNDWMRSTKGMIIRAYIEAPAEMVEEGTLAKDEFEAALKKVSRPQGDQSDEETTET